MTVFCSQCGALVRPAGSDDDTAAKVEERAAAMLAWCAQHGRAVTFDQHVSDDIAAELLGLQAATLANRRYLAAGPRFRKRGRRVEYAIAELAAFDVLRER